MKSSPMTELRTAEESPWSVVMGTESLLWVESEEKEASLELELLLMETLESLLELLLVEVLFVDMLSSSISMSASIVSGCSVCYCLSLITLFS